MNSLLQKDLTETVWNHWKRNNLYFFILTLSTNAALAHKISMKKEMLNVWIADSLFLSEVKSSCIIISTSVLTTRRVKNEILSRMQG